MADRLSHDWLARAVSLVGTAAVRSFASIPQKELDLEKNRCPKCPGIQWPTSLQDRAPDRGGGSLRTAGKDKVPPPPPTLKLLANSPYVGYRVYF